MKPITIKVVSHAEQRYDTVGDWYPVLMAAAVPPQHGLAVVVSRLGNDDYEFLVALHELVESYLCERRGITAADVDAFDFPFRGDGEPGDNPTAPYFREHAFATKVERLMADELGVDWAAYETTLGEVSA